MAEQSDLDLLQAVQKKIKADPSSVPDDVLMSAARIKRSLEEKAPKEEPAQDPLRLVPTAIREPMRVGLGNLGTAAEYMGRPGAAARQTIESLKEGKGVKESFGQGYDQLFKPTDTAPTGKQVFNTENPVAGFAGEIVTDPLTFLLPPVVKGAGYIGGKALLPLGRAAISGERTLREAATGIPKKAIEAFADRGSEVSQVLGNNPDIMDAANNLKSYISKTINETRQKANNAISTAFKTNGDNLVDISPVIGNLDSELSKINQTLRPDEHASLSELIGRIKQSAPNNQANLATLYDAKQVLNEFSSSSYVKDGKIFARSGKDTRAAKSSAKELDKIITNISPEIGAADDTLAQMHQLEKVLNKNILAKNKPFSTIVTGALDENKVANQGLKQIEKITGKPVLREAENFAAAAEFENPSLLPKGTTGKTFTRGSLGAGGGAVGALGIGLNPVIGGIIGAAFSSPKILKAQIQAGRVPKALLQQLVPTIKDSLSSEAINALLSASRTTEGKKIINSFSKEDK